MARWGSSPSPPTQEFGGPTHAPFWIKPDSTFGLFALTSLETDVHSRSAFHPPLGRLRIGAPRLWPLSPELHTSDCSFACPGSSTWVDKVPSRDTPYIGPCGSSGWCGPR